MHNHVLSTFLLFFFNLLSTCFMRYTILIFVIVTIASSLTAQLSTSDISFGDLRARSIGPATMSGRVSTIDGVSRKPEVLYVGSASGGIWKSESAGASFKPVFDDHIQSIGAVSYTHLTLPTKA